MSMREDFEGFVPISVYLPGQRVDGKAWKFANRRLLQQIEEDTRDFLPIVDAKLYTLDKDSAILTGEFAVLAVNKRNATAIEPKDAITPAKERE
ncbi:MAG: hypothetical protein IMF16_01595 [Proteobacteria bacterium]|nr:hypothetical protein [Pseudomonadota bacterium]